MEISTIKALILDMDGVIWRSGHPIGDLASIFSTLIRKEIAYAFATNNSSKTISDYEVFLNNLGIPVVPEQIYTSAKATAEVLAERFPDGGDIFVVGMAGLAETLNQYGFTISAEDPIAVVAGIDFDVTYEKLKTATLLIRSGVPFIGTNADKTFPTPEGQVPGAGSILAALTTASGVEPEVIGKPQPTMFQQALTHLSLPANQVMAVGDRLDTDIAGGQTAGCKTALTLSGVTTLEQAKAWQPAPDLIVEDLTELVERL